MLAGRKWLFLGIGLGASAFLWLASVASAQNIVVDAAPSHAGSKLTGDGHWTPMACLLPTCQKPVSGEQL
jgi:hypothetical protein